MKCTPLNDARYTVALEFCGYPEKRYVARFCGNWLGQDEKEVRAWVLCSYHKEAVWGGKRSLSRKRGYA